MFLTLTPNPCIERTFVLPSTAEFGEVHRVASDSIFVSAGGKGLNSARVAARFGARVMATGPIGASQHRQMSHLARTEGLSCDFVEVEADTRVCLNFLQGEGRKTEIIEAGRGFSRREGEALLEKWAELLRGAGLCALGGSYPPSAETELADHARRCCDAAWTAGVPLIYDGRGAAFERALHGAAPPWAIKPNLEEAQQILGRSLENRAQEVGAVREFLRLGVEVVLLSCGSRGLYLGQQNSVEWFEAPRVETVSAVGSGDCVVGAFAAHWLDTGDVCEAARLGVAAGSANAMDQKPAFIGPQDAAALLPLVRSERVNEVVFKAE